jgi:hypothetical protein
MLRESTELFLIGKNETNVKDKGQAEILASIIERAYLANDNSELTFFLDEFLTAIFAS